MEGEEAFKRLQKARQMDSRISTSELASADQGVKVNPLMHEVFLREIVESGGAPSVQELIDKADELGGLFASEQSFAISAYNKLT